MNKTYYICKYTPVELLRAFGGDCVNFDEMPQDFELAEEVGHPNLCGFGKALLEMVMRGDIKELVLVNCCDTIRSVFDILADSGKLDFLYMADMLHSDDSCSRKRTARQLKQLAEAYGSYRGTSFDAQAFRAAFSPCKNTGCPDGSDGSGCSGGSGGPGGSDRPDGSGGPHLRVLGARMGAALFQMAEEIMPLPVENATCVNNRTAGAAASPDSEDFDTLMEWYAGVLLGQVPCMRMADHAGRQQLYQDPDLKGIIYHTIKFCDFYSFEYADLKQRASVPLLKIESDYTVQSRGQILTRLEAFAESIASAGASGLPEQPDSPAPPEPTGDTRSADRKEEHMGSRYFAGIDSGSTSTDVVILNQDKEIVAGVILPTGVGAAAGAERALQEALKTAGLSRDEITAAVTTGYGRTAVRAGDKSITEITCHARGAHFLDPQVRTVIDIGGQDSKVIRIDESGAVVNFVMNDKCAAGTGRFLEMMAATMEMSLDEMSRLGLSYKEDITISSMCTVFAESEVVSLIAENKAPDDIVHGLNKAVAVKTAALVKRVGGAEKYMMTGGVSRNKGLVKELERKLGAALEVSDKAQLCGALGAALFAAEMEK